MLKLISVLYTTACWGGVKRSWRHIWRRSKEVWRSVTKGEGGVNFFLKSRDVIYGRPHACGDFYIFQQNSATAHTTCKMVKFLDREKPDFMPSCCLVLIR